MRRYEAEKQKPSSYGIGRDRRRGEIPQGERSEKGRLLEREVTKGEKAKVEVEGKEGGGGTGRGSRFTDNPRGAADGVVLSAADG